MKVALVVPTTSYNGIYPTYLAPSDFPVGLAYLAAALKRAGHDVVGLNVNNDTSYASARDMLHDKLTKMLEQDRPQLVGLGGLCSDYAFIKDAIAIVRAKAPGVPIVCGGGIITHDAEFAFEALRPDYCVVGEGEEVIVQLAGYLESGTPALRTIANLGYWEAGRPVFTAENIGYPALESRAFPDYSPFEPEKMLACSTHGARPLYRYSRPNPRIMPFVAARSCPFSCTFCVHQRGPRYRARPMADIFDEIGQLYTQYKFNILIILDELFAIDKKRLREFCEGIIERRETLGWDFDWLFQTHASAGLGLEDMKLAKEAGCYYFSYGVESMSPRVLDSMKKKITPEQIREAIELSQQAGIGFGGNFIFGDIAETHETIAESMRFMLEHCLDIQTHAQTISPYPGSLLFSHCLRQGVIKDKRQYYETIDRGIYNMTAIPDPEWSNWVSGLLFPLSAYPFIVAVEPLEVIDEPMTDPALYPPVRAVRVQCPHCKTEQQYRQPISDQSIQDGTGNWATGCPSCGKRFRVALNKEGKNTGAVLGRSISAVDLTRLAQNSIVPLATVRERFDVLLITSEPARWSDDHALGYLNGIGLEEGLAANGRSFITVPSLRGQASVDAGQWLNHLRTISTGRTFNQVWVDVVNCDLDDVLLAYIATLAPLRVGLVGESMRFGDEIHALPPDLRPRRRSVDQRLRAMTHAFATDPRDVEWINQRARVSATLWLPAVPHRVIAEAAASPERGTGLVPGMVTSEQSKLLDAPVLADALQVYVPEMDAATLPQLYEETNRQVVDALRSAECVPTEVLGLHADTLRQIHRFGLDALLAEMARAQLVATLSADLPPAFGYALLAMAAGRPCVVATDADPARLGPLVPGVNCLTYAVGQADKLAEQVQRLQSDPRLIAELVDNGLRTARQHSTKQRVAQLMRWLETGQDAAFDALDGVDTPTSSEPVGHGVTSDSAASGNALASLLAAASNAFRSNDLDTALLLLHQARRDHPSNPEVINLFSSVEAIRRERVHAKVMDIWGAAA